MSRILDVVMLTSAYAVIGLVVLLIAVVIVFALEQWEARKRG